ncbi:MAG: pyridoxamine 5'-phosphate oxidase family protein [Bacteroidota bacterium]
MKPENSAWTTLDESFTYVWGLLGRATADRKHPFRTPGLATLGTEGPRVRTVVLREVDRRNYSMYVHTDTRSDKVKEIQANPHISWLFWDPREKLQVRLSGKAQCLTDHRLSHSIWEKASLNYRKSYSPQLPPGTETESLQTGVETYAREGATWEESESWQDNFTVIVCEVEQVEWLLLHPAGHRRAKFNKTEEAWEGRWLVP